jgi:hypothetical protein
MSIDRWSRLEREGTRLYARGDDAAAAREFRRAARAARTSSRCEARLASSLFHLAVVYQRQGRYGRAGQFCAGSLRAEESALGASHPYVADILRRQATILRQLGRAGEADQAESRAQAIMAGRAASSREVVR